jgi:hypothetical protein
MGHDRVAEFGFQDAAYLRGALAGAAAGPIGDRCEIGRNRLEGCRGLAERLDPRLVLGRVKLYRAQRASLREELGEGTIGIYNVSTHHEMLICVKENRLAPNPMRNNLCIYY